MTPIRKTWTAIRRGPDPVYIPFNRAPVRASLIFAAICIISPTASVIPVVFVWGRTDALGMAVYLAANAVIVIVLSYGIAFYDNRRRNP